MKRYCTFFCFLIFLALLGVNVSCSGEDSSDALTIPTGEDQVPVITDTGGEVTLKFTSATNWTLTTNTDWVKTQVSTGKGGEQTVLLTVLPNETPDERQAIVTIQSGDVKRTITITQKQKDALTLTTLEQEITATGGPFFIEVKSNIEFEIQIFDETWIHPIENRALDTNTLSFQVDINESTEERVGEIVISGEGLKETFTIRQAGKGLYASSDFSEDGEYVTLQTATEGNGIDIVLMGDAYSDRLIKDGTYETIMKKACEAFFSEQPYTDFRHLFNVHYVKVVSVNEEYREGSANTALSCYFGRGTKVGGNDNKCTEYALKIPGMTTEKLDNTLIIVMMNSTRYAGTCWMYWSYGWTTDYGEGKAIAYFPVGETDEALASVLHHEAGGHGFGKLADEYDDNNDVAPESEKQELQSLAPLGWYKNVDITSDPSAVHWSKFISDAVYEPEKIGVYEGGYTYAKGFYRPTETSIMRYNIGGFNAPSREMIYYRIHKLAYGADWTYDYNGFKNWDAKNIREHGARAVTVAPKNFVPLAPPVVTVIR